MTTVILNLHEFCVRICSFYFITCWCYCCCALTFAIFLLQIFFLSNFKQKERKKKENNTLANLVGKFKLMWAATITTKTTTTGIDVSYLFRLSAYIIYVTWLTFLSANFSGKSCVTIHPAPLELLLGGDASELVDTDFSVLVLKKVKTTIQNRRKKNHKIKTKQNKSKNQTEKYKW